MEMTTTSATQTPGIPVVPVNRNVELAVGLVSAFVANNPVQASTLPSLLKEVHEAVINIGAHDLGAGTGIAKATNPPAVNPKKSVFPDHIVCLEDGKSFKSLKRHLMTHFGLTPEDYRTKWSLPSDYPMVAPNYAAARSKLAKKMGLGRKRK